MRDALGRRRSSRSIPTGPGSRGGTFHDPVARAAYYRAWRARHPEYVERDRRRRLLGHNIARLIRAA
jgi:hypothetical protein